MLKHLVGEESIRNPSWVLLGSSKYIRKQLLLASYLPVEKIKHKTNAYSMSYIQIS